MTANIGRADRLVRAIIGAGLILTSGMGVVGGAWVVLAMALGCIGVYTAAAAYCPLYGVLRITPAGLGSPGDAEPLGGARAG
jgi:hypothetical protein